MERFGSFFVQKTNKCCRKLYSIGGYFFHREAFKGFNCLYESQTHSKYERMLNKKYSAYFGSDQLYKQLYQKYFKKTYGGNPTKKYLKLTQMIQQAEKISYKEIEMLLIK